MSLSRFYKDRGNFIPEQLVPRPSEETDWHPVSIPEDSTYNDLTAETEEPSSQTPEELSHFLENVLDDEDNSGNEKENDSPQPETKMPAPPAPTEPPAPSALPDLETVREEAFKSGLEEGLNQAERDFGSAAGALVQACELVNDIRETILKNSREEMIELTILLAEKIIRHSVTKQNATILETVEEAILKAVKSSEFHIYLHPDDMTIIKENSGDLVARVSGLQNIVLKTDPAIERGGCKVESDNCTVDATLASQIDVIRKVITEDQ